MNNIELEYRDWLIEQVNIVEDLDYGPLLRELFNIEFYWLVLNDEDRAMDGVALREDFLDDIGSEFEEIEELNLGPARVLEVLIGVAKRIEFQLFGGPYMDDWGYEKVFWELVWNLDLGECSGTLFEGEYDKIRQNVTHFLDRSYKRHKNCNIFDIRDSDKNLAKMSIWAQMMVYIREKWPLR